MIPFTDQSPATKKASQAYYDARLTPLPSAITQGKRVYVCAPFSDNQTTNTVITAELCRRVCATGAIAIAPHLLYPRFLSNEVPHEKEMSVKCAIEWLQFCQVLFVWDMQTISAGMLKEIKHCEINCPKCVIVYASSISKTITDG